MTKDLLTKTISVILIGIPLLMFLTAATVALIATEWLVGKFEKE